MVQEKPLLWMGSSYKDLSLFPKDSRQVMGFALYMVQIGEEHVDAKPLKGFGGAGVLEIVDSHDGSAYRAVYTVTLDGFVLCFTRFQLEV